jgi:hypothetical protein
MKISRKSVPKKQDWPLLVVGCTVIVVLMTLMVSTRDAGEELTASSALAHAEYMLQDETRNVLHPPKEEKTFLRKKSPQEIDEGIFDDLKEKFLNVEDKLDKIHGVIHDEVVQKKRDFLDKMKLDGKNNKDQIAVLEEKLEDAESTFKKLEEEFILI